MTGKLVNLLTIPAVEPHRTQPNAAILPVGPDGSISLYTQSGAHLLADVSGYVLGPLGPSEKG